MKEKILVSCLDAVFEVGIENVNIEYIAYQASLPMGRILENYSNISSILKDLYKYSCEHLESYLRDHWNKYNSEDNILKDMWFKILNWCILNSNMYSYMKIFSNISNSDCSNLIHLYPHELNCMRKNIAGLIHEKIESEDSDLLIYSIGRSIDFALEYQSISNAICDRTYFCYVYDVFLGNQNF